MLDSFELENELSVYLNALASEIGPRPTGSAANRAAAATVRQALAETGLAVEEIPFDCPVWEDRGTRLEQGGQALPAYANIFSPPCEVEGELVPLGTVAELERAELTGRIGVMMGNLAQSPLTPMNCPLYQVERDLRINQLLLARRPAALITVNMDPGARVRVIEDVDMTIPSATVPAEVGLALLRRPELPARLTIRSERRPGRSGHVVAFKPGKRPERVVLCAHFDSKLDTPGALDNAGAVAALLALARHLARRDLTLGLEIIAFDDEETVGVGDGVYVDTAGERLGSMLAVINMDGVGQLLGANSITAMAHSAAFQALVEQVAVNYPGVQWVEPWPQSNHSTFAWRGVPALALGSVGVRGLHHTPQDTVEWASTAKLAEAVTLIVELVEALQDKGPAWTRP